MSYGINKLLTLPSNGLEYNKFCYLKPLTFEYFLFNEDIESEALNRTEIYTTVLRKYTELPVDVTELYMSDLYFLWVNFIMQIVEDKYYIHSKCAKCDHENRLEINLFEISVDYYDYKDVIKEIHFPDKKTVIKYRRRKVKDNLDFGIKNLINNNNLGMDQIIDFMVTQITEIVCDNEIISGLDAKDFVVNYLQNEDISQMFQKHFLDQDFGIKNNLKYSCKQCNHANHTELFTNYGNAMFITERSVKNEKAEIFKMLLNLSRLPSITLDELMKMPYNSIDDLTKTLQEIKFEAIV